jgi:ribosomal-protein-alanine N-acetyltransferase
MDTQLLTPRLLLREFTEADAQAVHRYASDPEVTRYMTWEPNQLDQTQEYIRQQIELRARDPRYNFELAVCLKSGELIGAVGVRIRSATHREADFGYVLARSHWNQGYMTEAARRLLIFGFQELGLHRIYATAAEMNLASRRVLEKIGMQREGLLREHLLVQGNWRTSVLYAALESDERS